ELAVEPASRLVDRLADEIGRELAFELVAALMRIAPLRERHRAGVVPAVDHIGHALHARTRRERRVVRDGVDVGFVDLQVFGQVGEFFPSLLPYLGATHTGLLKQLVIAADRFHLASFLADPDRQWRPPESLA